ncbi:MAG: hypothetical protein LM586_02680 [Desulfurococcales archaeon]|jgi:hypothetical protein|nr:hypothetical protein [Desulfurococcales archaeon]MCC6062605.1 hypothetical protein [Desulfurococcales archaeon]
MYIKASIGKERGFDNLFWWSGAKVSFENCPKKEYLFDLVTYSYTNDPMSLLLTARKLDPRIKTEVSTDIKAPHINPLKTGPDVIEEALYILNKDREIFIEKEMRESEPETSEKTVERPRGLMRLFRRQQILYLRRREIQRDILRGLVNEMLKSLCIKDPTARPKIIFYSPLFFLVNIDFDKRLFYIFLGKKIVRSRSHEKYVFNNQVLIKNLNDLKRLWRG